MKTEELLRDIEVQQRRYEQEIERAKRRLPASASELELLEIKHRGNEIIKAVIEKMAGLGCCLFYGIMIFSCCI